LPEFKEGHYIVRMTMAPGTSTEASLEAGRSISRALLQIPDIQSVSQEVGRAEQGEDTNGPEFSELHVELAPDHRDEELVLDEIRATLGRFPGIAAAVTPFLTERIEEVLSGARGAVVVTLFGSDLGMLDAKAEEVRRIVGRIPGAADVFLQPQSGSPEVTVSLRPDRLRLFGLQPVNVLETVQTAYQGATLNQVYENERVFDVVVMLDEASRRDVDAIGSLLIRNPGGKQVPLREVAHVETTSGRYLIEHEATLRRRQITSNVEGRDLVSFADEVKRRLQTELALPPGLRLAFGGEAEAEAAARRELLLHSSVAAVMIGVLLALVFRHARNMLLVLANVPFALAGGAIAVLASGGSLSIGSLVGFISLFGISMRNSILMVTHYEDLVAKEGASWNLETAIRGASERLLPILMTALVVALGLLPIALNVEQPGKEIEGPMAIVILGGLVTSTALNLLVLPTLALRYGRFGPREAPP
jgi:Cu/Ag efflux pump CusA